jgi:hypothetical protein
MREVLAMHELTFSESWEETKRTWEVATLPQWKGEDNMEFWTDPRDPSREFFLRVRYGAESRNPKLSLQVPERSGGANFYARLHMEPTDSLYLRYYVRFADGFEFAKGGKLPGLFGGDVRKGRDKIPDGLSAGDTPDGKNGFSTRYMWRAEGAGELYAYVRPECRENRTGKPFKYGVSWKFEGCPPFMPGRWYCLEQRVKLNRPGHSDGEIQVWVTPPPVESPWGWPRPAADRKLVFEKRKLPLRTDRVLKIQGIFFSTFFGGHEDEWASPGNTYADFGRFAYSTSYYPDKGWIPEKWWSLLGRDSIASNPLVPQHP